MKLPALTGKQIVEILKKLVSKRLDKRVVMHFKTSRWEKNRRASPCWRNYRTWLILKNSQGCKTYKRGVLSVNER
jgi:hypothetical protein